MKGSVTEAKVCSSGIIPTGLHALPFSPMDSGLSGLCIGRFGPPSAGRLCRPTLGGMMKSLWDDQLIAAACAKTLNNTNITIVK